MSQRILFKAEKSSNRNLSEQVNTKKNSIID